MSECNGVKVIMWSKKIHRIRRITTSLSIFNKMHLFSLNNLEIHDIKKILVQT